MIADFNPKTGQLDIYNGNQAPNAHRTVYAHVAGLAEHMIRIRCNDIGGGFGNKVPVYPGLRVRDRRLDRRRRPGQVDRGPLGEPDVDRVRARLRDARRDVLQGRQDHRPARRRDRRPRRVRLDRPADQVPGRLLPHRVRLLRPRGRARAGQGRLHEQGAGRRRLPLLVPDHRGRVPRRADGRRARARDGRRPDRAADAAASSVPSSSRTRRRPAGRTTRATTRRRCSEAMRHRRLRRAPARAGREARPRRADGHRRVVLHRGRRRRSAQAHGHPRPRDERRRRPPRAPVRQGDRQHLRARPRARATRRRSPRSSPRSSGSRPRTSQVRHGDTDQHPVRPRHLRLAVDAGLRGRGRGRLAQGPRQGPPDRGDDARDQRRGPRLGEGPLVRQGRPREGRDDRGDRRVRVQRRADARRAWRAASTPR